MNLPLFFCLLLKRLQIKLFAFILAFTFPLGFALLHLLHRLQVALAHVGDILLGKFGRAVSRHLRLDVGRTTQQIRGRLCRIPFLRTGIAGGDQRGLVRRQL